MAEGQAREILTRAWPSASRMLAVTYAQTHPDSLLWQA